MRRGYFTPPVLIILAIIIFAVAILIAINTDLVKRIKNEPLPTPIPSSSPTSDAGREPNGSAEIANWKTYNDEKHGFLFKYPKDWATEIEACPNNSSDKDPTDLILLDKEFTTECYNFLLGLEGPYTFAISINETTNFDLNESIIGREGFVPRGEFITIGGLKAAKVWPVGQSFYGRIEIFLNHKGRGIEIVFPNTDKQGGYDKIYDEILSTFQFLN